jgi:hypothetical protein
MRAASLLLLGTIAAAACRGTSAPAPGDAAAESQSTSALDDTLRIALGEGVRVSPAGTLVTFDSVLGDSRCRPDVTCVWAGSVRVRLTFSANAGSGASAELETNTDPRSTTFGGDVFTLLPEVEPPAGSAGRYRISLRVQRP